MKVFVDAARCVGHGRCYALGPDVFLDDERGHCRIETTKVPPEFATQARMGAANCPEDAIRLEDD